jgi:hypothetical protein
MIFERIPAFLIKKIKPKFPQLEISLFPRYQVNCLEFKLLSKAVAMAAAQAVGKSVFQIWYQIFAVDFDSITIIQQKT